jgi:adenylyltransferase/sulfurtransferase
LDASDNPPTRYLINDACVLLGRPLISACAVRMEGQLTVYNYENGPCYRCLYPIPPPKAAISNCDEGGVLGCVVGVLGCIQAMEAIKIVIQLYSNTKRDFETYSGRMLLYNGFLASFRTVKLRTRRSDCAVCGSTPEITCLLDDYEAFCGVGACDKSPSEKLLSPQDRISCKVEILLFLSLPLIQKEYHDILTSNIPHLLIDVRPKLQFDICALPNSVNIPIDQLPHQLNTIVEHVSNYPKSQLIFICRRGNKSQHAVILVKKKIGIDTPARDIIGGLQFWVVIYVLWGTFSDKIPYQLSAMCLRAHW